MNNYESNFVFNEKQRRGVDGSLATQTHFDTGITK